MYNALLRATTMSGRAGHVVEALPIDRLSELIDERNRGAGVPPGRVVR